MDAAARKARRNLAKEKFWRAAIREHGGSGKTVREFCGQKDVNESLFYAWRRELKLRDSKQAEPAGFVELIRPGGQAGPAGVSLRVGERVSIVVERGFDGATLKAVLSAVGV
jgi:transposase-like protein